MPAWSKVLGDQQIADVAEYVFGTFILPGESTAGASPQWKSSAPGAEKKKQ